MDAHTNPFAEDSIALIKASQGAAFSGPTVLEPFHTACKNQAPVAGLSDLRAGGKREERGTVVKAQLIFLNSHCQNGLKGP